MLVESTMSLVLWAEDRQLPLVSPLFCSSGNHDVPVCLSKCSKNIHTLCNRCYITPLLGAYIADEKWGRFRTITVSVIITIVGHLILIISSIPPVIVHPNGALAALCLAIIIVGLGTGGFKANVSPLVAEQQRHVRPFVRQTKSGERVVVDPTLTTSRIYMVRFLLHVVNQHDGSLL